MEAESHRIDDLRRRIQQDPASIAFAHLAEEHRRAGDLQEAVRVCREGLEYHPAYLLAHVTLGRALMELEQYPEARTEFEYVLRVAPDNLVALKSLEELQHREDPASQDAGVARTPLKLSPSPEHASPGRNPPLAAPPPQAQVASPPKAEAAPPPEAQVASPAEVQVASPTEAQVTSPPEAQVASPSEAQVAAPPEAVDPALDELQGWLAALDAARTDRH